MKRRLLKHNTSNHWVWLKHPKKKKKEKKTLCREKSVKHAGHFDWSVGPKYLNRWSSKV